MSIEILKWDSDFFQFNVGKIIVDDNITHKRHDIIDNMISLNIRLLYLFTNPDFEYGNELANNAKGNLVDRKVILYKHIDVVNRNMAKNIQEFDYKHIPHKLYELAHESGIKSRYRLDKNFKEGVFENMYSLWLEKSIDKTIADKVFIYKENNQILGFITLKIGNNVGTIGLISVDKYCRGKNIGSSLINECEKVLQNKNILNIEVATQKDNHIAMRFYEKCNFHIKTETNIYHIWR